MPRIVFRPSALRDLIDLYDYVADRAGSQVANAYIGRIEQACRALEDFPERGRRRDDIHPGVRTVGFERRVVIAFRIIAGNVEILRVLYGGRDLEASFQAED